MGDIKYTQSLIFISIFAIAIISYAVGFASDNSAVVSIDEEYGLTTMGDNIQENLTTFFLDTGNSSESFFRSTITGQEQTTVTGGEFKLSKIPSILGNVFSSINKNIFGGSPAFAIVLTVFSSFLVYVGIRYIWKTWKGGNPD